LTNPNSSSSSSLCETSGTAALGETRLAPLCVNKPFSARIRLRVPDDAPHLRAGCCGEAVLLVRLGSGYDSDSVVVDKLLDGELRA
jgi:hypothetical protein